MAYRAPASIEEASARIAQRRYAAADESLDFLPDDPVGVIAYVCSHRRVPPQVLGDDARDCLAMIRLLRPELDQQEHALIRMAQRAGLSLSQLTGSLGVESRQAVDQRALRQEALQAEHGRDERAIRAERARERSEAGWLARHGARVEVTARALARLPMPETAQEFAEMLADALSEKDLALPSVMSLMAALTREIMASGHVGMLDGPAGREAFRLVRGWEQIQVGH